MKLVFALGEYYSKQLTETQLRMYAEDLSAYAVNDISEAIKKYRCNPANEFFPLPAKLITLIKPHMDDKDNAIDAVNRIIAAVSRFGWTNSQSAKEFMGELAWETCNRFGGWKSLCETLCGENEGILRAQLRELAGVVAKKSMRGELNLVPSLPTPETNQVKNLISTTIKSLT